MIGTVPATAARFDGSGQTKTMTIDPNLMREVEDAIAKGSIARRNELLQRVTDLFIVGAARYNDDEVVRFDNIIARLAVDIELSARALLAARLAPIPNAPPRTIRTLAFDDAIDVAGPILIQSERLDDPTLIENARQKSQEHLLAISRRHTLSEAVTDVLVERGDQQVLLSTVENRGARISDFGFGRLVERSAGDDRLSESVGSRPEIPPQLFLRLLEIASDTVRAKLEATHPHAKREVGQAVAEVTGRIREQALKGSPDYEAAQALVQTLSRSGQLDDARLRAFAESGRFAEAAAALALMSDLPLSFIEQAIVEDGAETLLLVAKVVGLSWPTIRAILLLRAGKNALSAEELAQCLSQFERLKPSIANEIVRFYRLRERGGTNGTAH